jgi:triacylglycerol lipase
VGIDTEAFRALTPEYCRDVFNPTTPDNPNVKYFSVGACAKEPPTAGKPS